MNLRTEPGFLDTGASMLADLTLLAYILLIVPAMLAGFILARRKLFEPYHKYVMTSITLFNWLLIFFVMAASYSDGVASEIPDRLDENFFLFPTLHLVTGGIAQLLATYLVIRMWFEKRLPDWFKIKNIKTAMRITLVCWMLTAALGVTIYFTWYDVGETQAATDTPNPAATLEPSSTDEPSTTEEPITTEEPATTEEP